ncbi:N-formylglutamate amidohydrolase [Dongia deserti]|uniref:N-formylglutamate amidohydrolase n=1 Tax=Dongia deserti TaxID=2268030 RepID=UPI000E657F61|nr:N-formylglutamate amidohydrolase [Dongia deserti]
MLQSLEHSAPLLSERDPAPVEVVNPDGRSVFVLTCEHAGRHVPSRLRDLGIAATEMDRHIAYDIGAEGLARKLSTILDAPLILQRFSRLVVDCNRPFDAPDCIPAVSDGTRVPVNENLTEHDRRQRFEAIHQPFHRAVTKLLDQRANAATLTILVSIHSFTPHLTNGAPRPWLVGALSNRDPRLAQRFIAIFQTTHPGISCAHNEPYVVDDRTDYTIPVHGERRGLPHLLLEVRNDVIADYSGQERWSRLIAGSLTTAATADMEEFPR